MSTVTYDYAKFTQSVTNRIPYVDVSIESNCARSDCFGYSGGAHYKDWTMRLQRKSAGQSNWTTIGTRTGYVSASSPSHRNFSSVGNHGSIRVRTTLHAGAYHGVGYLNDSVR